MTLGQVIPNTLRVAFSHLQCANRPFWPLVSKYTIFCFWNFKPFKSYNNKKVAHKQFCNMPLFWYLQTRPSSFVRCTLRFFDYPYLMTSDIFLYHFLILKVLSFFYVQPQMCKKKKIWIFVECLTHGKFNPGHFMKSNFLALDRYLSRYSGKTKKSAARGFWFASNKKSLPTSVLKIQGSYRAWKKLTIDTGFTFIGIIFFWKALTPRL